MYKNLAIYLLRSERDPKKRYRAIEGDVDSLGRYLTLLLDWTNLQPYLILAAPTLWGTKVGGLIKL